MAKRGLTLVEMLVVVSIIGVLVALLLPGIQAAREAARRSACGNNIRQVSSALDQYHAAHSSLPIPTSLKVAHDTCETDIYGPYLRNLQNKAGANPNTVYTFIVAILPYIGQQAIYDRMKPDEVFNSVTNLPLVQTVIPTLVCPTDPDAADPILPLRYNDPGRRVHGLWYAGSAGPTATEGGFTYCPANSGAWCWVSSNPAPCVGNPNKTIYHFCDGRNWYGLFGRRWIATRFDQVHDGLSNTVMLAETLPKIFVNNTAYNAQSEPYVTLAAPINGVPLNPAASPFLGGTYSSYWQSQVQSPRSMHPGGCHMAMADGSVAFLSDLTALEVICRLGNRKDGEFAAVP